MSSAIEIDKLKSEEIAHLREQNAELWAEKERLAKAAGTLRELLRDLVKRTAKYRFDHETGGYTAGIEEFPGCLTEGDTLEEAHQMLMDAAESWILASIEMGHEIPIPLVERGEVQE